MRGSRIAGLFTGLFIITAIVAVLVSGCNPGTAKNRIGIGKAGKKLKVVTTFAPLYSFAVNVAGTKADVENLVPIGTSIHSYQARPSDIKKIAQADVLVINGTGIETFLSGIVDSASNPRLKIVDTSKSIKILGSQNADEKTSGDPHIWLSPKNAIRQVETIRDALAKADPANAAVYRKDAETYVNKLKTLDSDITKELAQTKKQRYIVFHNAYRYFESEYGLKSAAVIEEFPGKEPSPRYLKGLIDLIKNKDVRIVFVEPQFSPKLVNSLRRDYKVYVGVLDPIGDELSKDGYEKNMRKNLESFKRAFEKVGGNGG